MQGDARQHPGSHGWRTGPESGTIRTGIRGATTGAA